MPTSPCSGLRFAAMSATLAMSANLALTASFASAAGAQEPGASDARPPEPGTAAWILPAERELGHEGLDWHMSLGSALLAADAADRPVFLWAMNGHPFGCT